MAANDDDDQRSGESRNRTRRDGRDVLDIRDSSDSQRSDGQRRRDLFAEIAPLDVGGRDGEEVMFHVSGLGSHR